MDLDELLYADDTAVITDSAATGTNVLRMIECDEVQHGLGPNRSNCQAIVLSEDGAITRFEDGTSMAQPAAGK